MVSTMAAAEPRPAAEIATTPATAAAPLRTRESVPFSGPILQASGLTKRYGGLLANRDIDFAVDHGERRGVIGPNGAGKTTFFKMLTCEVPPSAGKSCSRAATSRE